MKTREIRINQRATRGFTLIEMIGVMAIMAILATVMTPNILQSIERTAVKAEVDNLHMLGGEIGLYLRDNAAMPTTNLPPAVPNWPAQLGTYSSLNPTDILTNKRLMNRMYVPDPTVANQRALLLSSMRTGVALPTSAQVSANFQTIWNTASGAVPVAAGWGAWNASNVDYLVIERVSLASIYRTSLATYSWSINNSSGTDTISCVVTWANGAGPTTYTLGPNKSCSTLAGPPVLAAIRPGDKLAFYKSGTPTMLFSYVVSDSGKTFTYTTSWIAQ